MRTMVQDLEIIRQLAGFVADQMTEQSGMEWKVDTARESSGAHLTHTETGADVFVMLDWRNRDRVLVQSSYPAGTFRQVYPDPADFKASVARDRDPAKIAGDILRKVAVPAFFAETKRCKERLTRDDDMLVARGILARNLADTYRRAGGRVTIGPDTVEGHSVEVSWWNVEPKVDASISYPADEVKLTIDDLTPDQAVKVLELLNSF